MDADNPHPLAAPQTARASLRAGDRFVMEAEVRATPLGLLAVGGLVAVILLAVPPIVRAHIGRPRLPPARPIALPPPGAASAL